MGRKLKPKQTQQQPQTPPKKPTMPLTSPNSNSFSQIYEAYFPRTPVRKVNATMILKDQLGQVIEKGISNYSIVTHVTFNSVTSFNGIQVDFSKFQAFDKRKNQVLEWSLMIQKLIQPYTNKTSIFQTMQSVFKVYRQSKDSYFMLSTSNYLALFSYDGDTPYVIFADRYDIELKPNTDIAKLTCKYLEDKQIQSIMLNVQTPYNTLFPNVHSLSSSKYAVSLVVNKHINQLFNCIMNQAIEKENVDVAASFPFHNSCSNAIQTYNGIDMSVNDTQNLFQMTSEFKVQFEGLFTVQQILDIKQQLISSHPDIVVSDIKLNPVTTLFNKTLFDRIHQIINDDE